MHKVMELGESLVGALDERGLILRAKKGDQKLMGSNDQTRRAIRVQQESNRLALLNHCG
jgi:hypothetical protein